jgi:23S rRNA (cytosine1962-C5)-methyltransferase
MANIKIVLKSGKDQSLHRLHPWIFSGAIKKIYGSPGEGDVVDLYDNKDNFLAVGYYQPGSIAVRVMDFEQTELDIDFYRKRLGAAIKYRKISGLFDLPDTNVYRLIHGEGDGLPGLIVDYYNGVAVLQFHSIGIYREREIICDLLRELLGDSLKAIYNKSESTLPNKTGIVTTNDYLWNTAEPAIVSEYGYRFYVDWVKGQKTGFFIDQRENRKLLQSYSENKSVLNMFGYTGGFSVYAMHNAKQVDTVDVSERAVKIANQNIEYNFPDDNRHSGIVADAFKYLDDDQGKYDLIVLDPPAFAKHHNVLHNALQGYKRINIKAIEKIKPGGIIFTFSCSQVVSKENFRKSVFAAAANTRRKVKILHQLNQPADHPVNIYHPESEYLKGLVIYVE